MDRPPDWLAPSTSPSRRWARSSSASTKPSRVEATAASRCQDSASGSAALTSRHTPGSPPRPIRPRSWCSWLMPKRSASQTTIIEAFGTSTPTSTIVVATSTSRSPLAKDPMTASFSSAGSCPCRTPSRTPASGPERSCSANCSTPSPSPSLAVVPMRGATTNTWRPWATSSRTRSHARSTQAGRRRASTTVVVTSARPCGSSASVETSRSPNTVIATDRGIGVAVSTSTCGRACARSVRTARCSTPKRCCSSTTTRPRSTNWRWSASRAWVPTMIPASPEAILNSADFFTAAGIEPVRQTTSVACSGAPRTPPPIPSSPISPTIVWWCCWASTSVGASRTAWPPASTTASMARSATRVLPDPTSPCNSRCMGWVRARSANTSSLTRRCPSVSVNGRRASNASSNPSGRRGRGPADCRAFSARR